MKNFIKIKNFCPYCGRNNVINYSSYNKNLGSPKYNYYINTKKIYEKDKYLTRDKYCKDCKLEYRIIKNYKCSDF
jgi:hypothetical protein